MALRGGVGSFAQVSGAPTVVRYAIHRISRDRKTRDVPKQPKSRTSNSHLSGYEAKSSPRRRPAGCICMSSLMKTKGRPLSQRSPTHSKHCPGAPRSLASRSISRLPAKLRSTACYSQAGSGKHPSALLQRSVKGNNSRHSCRVLTAAPNSPALCDLAGNLHVSAQSLFRNAQCQIVEAAQDSW